ncbi:MAG: mechanosensitive ion channel [Bacteroidota bacterium]|nr:mechanosensitive ion channel [Bacteroidota bacterium]
MIDFLEKELLHFKDISLSYLDIGGLILLVFAAIFINALVGRFIKKLKFFSKWELNRKRILFNGIRIIVWVIVIGLILEILGLNLQNFWNFYLVGSADQPDQFSLQPSHLFGAFMVFIFTRIAIMGLERVFTSGSYFREKDQGKSRSVYKFLSYLIWVIAFIIILGSTGLELKVLYGAGAALLVGIGFGLQQIFADLISGIFLLFEGNLKEGDVVELNNGIIGKVAHVGIRTSKILTRDDYTMIIPNTQFITKEVINWTHNEENTRFRIDVGVAYGSDVRLVEKVLLECAKGNSEISIEPKPFVRFDNFGNSSLDFQLFFWSRKTFRIENLKSDLRFNIDEQFRKNDVQIPFPQVDVHMKTK